MIEESEWKEAAKALSAADEVVVACHVAPDGDALGSMLGLTSFLERQGKKVWRTWGSGKIQIPPQYLSLPGIDSIVNFAETPETPEVFVAIDCGDLRRLELVTERFLGAGLKINIDHHISNDRFGDINLVDPNAASSSEVAYELITRMGGIPDRNEATCFYTGIVTDTGRFQYSNASVGTLRTAAALRELGVDHERVAIDIFESSSFDYLHVLGIVLSRARLEDGMVWSYLDQQDLGGVTLDETEDFIDVLRSVRESKLAVLLKQLPDRSYKVSLRSRGDVDVSEIAAAFGGGGHKRAAGLKLRGKPEEVVAAIKQHLTSD
ncbi:MAG: bifunctional oligoribonuclease/PAP phosphatase NrnA [Actinobacteria bacterium]|nr:bifunctional oligoribonuclease/PAP phosphatase NrnA [Actinomycetota bacterium]